MTANSKRLRDDYTRIPIHRTHSENPLSIKWITPLTAVLLYNYYLGHLAWTQDLVGLTMYILLLIVTVAFMILPPSVLLAFRFSGANLGVSSLGLYLTSGNLSKICRKIQRHCVLRM
ncbi:hypothetical protein B0H34DRAFT_734359 [Crassisporium funariophilum]|nr:hypothetical protein B0H34DRAFT_734359 [Crassisporium funariophilum]